MTAYWIAIYKNCKQILSVNKNINANITPVLQIYNLNKIHEVLDLANHVPIISNVNNISNELIDIYPNPANNTLNIVSNTVGINTIYIYNTNGLLVLSKQVDANQTKLNTSILSKGIYLIDIKSKETSIKQKIIIE